MKTTRWLVSVLALATVGLLVLHSEVPAAAGATLVVDDDGYGNAADCDSADVAYSTIQAAIDAAAPGDTISVCAGTYGERLTVSKSLDLRGAQFGVDPTQTGARANPAEESVVDLTALGLVNPNVLVEVSDGVSNVFIAGFTFIGSPTFHYADEAIIRAWDNDIAVEDNIMDGYIAVLYKGPGQNLDVLRNRVTFNKSGVIVQPGTANNVNVSDNVLMLGATPGGDESAIYMTGVTQGVASGNTAVNLAPNGRGVVGSNLTQLTVSGNTLTGNKDGISIWGSSTFIAITDNDLSDSLRYGVNIKGQDVAIEGNKITDCGDSGVSVDKHVLNTERVTVSNNDLSGNALYGLIVNTALVTEIVSAEDNWWGSANGPTHASNMFNVGSQGVPVSDGADFAPWLDGPPPGGASFAPVTTTDPVGSHASIQAGVDASNAGGTVNAKAGTYTETIRVDGTKASNISVVGADKATTFFTGGVRFEGSYIGLTVENFTITGDGRQRAGLAEATIGASSGASVVTDARFSNNILDGEGITGIGGGRFGAYLSSISGSFTFENNEVKNYRGWGTLELNQAYRTVSSYTFTGNTVHDNSGSSALRGNPSDRTDTVTVTGNVFDNNGGGDSWASLEINEAETVTVSDNAITNTQAGNWGEGEALQFWHITLLTVTDNTIEDNYQGIYFPGDAWASDLSGVEIHSNSISGNTEFGLQADAGNTGTADAEDNWWGSANGPTHASNTFNVGSQGDAVSDNVDFVPWLDGPPPGGASFAPVTTTDPVGGHSSIQAGVDFSNAGGTVNAKAGTFTETIDVDGRSDLSMAGESRDTVIVKPGSTLCWDVGGYGCGRQVAVRVVSSTDIALSGMTFDFDLVKSDGVTGVLYWDSTGVIDDNILKNMSVPDTLSGGGVSEITTYIRAPGYSDGARAAVTVGNNVFQEAGRVAVLTHDFANTTIQDNTFSKAIDDFGYAIEMGSESTGAISGNTIYGYDTPAYDGSTAAGIYVENAFTGSCFGGVPHVDKPVTISGNTIFGNQYGLWLGNEYDCYAGDVDISITLQGNDIHDNLEAGVYVVDEDRADGSSVTLNASGNDVSNNGPVGYYFNTYGDGELHATLTGETIAGQATGILAEDNASGSSGSLYDLAVHGSSIGGSSYGLNNTTTALVNAEDNWWGSANGPTHMSNTFNMGSQGVALSDNVDFVPWLDGPPPGGDSFAPVTTTDPVGGHASIQAGVDASNAGGTVNAVAGTFTENVTVNKSVTVAGAALAPETIVIPAVSNPNPCAGSSLCGSANAASNVFLVQASDVTIHDLTVDGDNPALTSGIVRGGADLDARNGIVEDYYAGVCDNLTVFYVTVRNIYLRGIYASSGGTGFNIVDNMVQNVQGESQSICIFNFGGSGTISDNSASDCNDGISANWSAGTQFLGNTVTNSGSGIHSDNNGTVGDLIQGNTVTNSTTGGYGIWTFVPYVPIVVQGNTVSNVDVGLAASGQAPATSGSTSFVNNQVTGKPGSTGVYVTTDQFGWGSGNVNATFIGNTVTGHADGFVIEAQAGYTATVNASGNSISGNSVSGATTTGAGTHSATMEDNWWGSASGPTHPSNTFNVPTQGDAVVGNVDFVPWLDAAPPGGASFAPVTTTSPVDSYASIEAGVNGSNAGGTVNAKAGTFMEIGQIVIGKDLTIDGAGAGSTIVKPSVDTGSSGDARGWFLVDPGFTFNLSGVTLDGTGHKVWQAIRHKGQGTISDCAFTNIKYEASGPNYAGTAIAAAGSPAMNVDVTNCTFDEIGRVGVLYFGTGITDSTYSNNTYVGKGAGNWLDYAVEVGAGAHATISGNTLSDDLGVANDDSTSAGILVTTYYGAGTQATISGNTISNSSDGIAVGYDDSDTSVVEVSGNIVSAPTAGSGDNAFDSVGTVSIDVHDNTFTGGYDAVLIGPGGTGSIADNVVEGYTKNGITVGKGADDNTGTNVTVLGNTVTGGGAGQVYAQNGIQVGPNAAAAIEGNTVSGHVYTLGTGVCAGPGTKADAAYYASCWTAAGVLVYQGTATLTGNVVTDNQVGIDVGSSANVNYNEITNNVVYGMNNNTTAVMDAEQNWWGACSGPYHPTLNPLGTGDAVSDNVDFDPWISGACDYDGDRLSDDQERLVVGTDWQNPDTDGDGCDDGREYVSMPGFSPLAWYDVYDVPVPANADMTPNGPKNRAVDISDVLAVLTYTGATDNGPPNGNGVDYDSDKNGDTVEDGRDYDRSPSPAANPPWEAGSPNGAIDMSDVLTVLAQSGLDCSGPP
jgi:parallel beta-helix repeat protein